MKYNENETDCNVLLSNELLRKTPNDYICDTLFFLIFTSPLKTPAYDAVLRLG